MPINKSKKGGKGQDYVPTDLTEYVVWQCHRLVNSDEFGFVIMAMIVLNTTLMASEHHGQGDALTEVQFIGNYSLPILKS